MKRWRYDRAHGVRRNLDPEPVINHIVTLRGAGWSIRSIGAEAGVSPSAVSSIAKGQRYVTRKIAEKILAVDPETVPSRHSKDTTEVFVSRVGVQRRIEALLYMGWTCEILKRDYGINPSTAYQQGRWVSRSTYDKVARAYEELAHRVGPSKNGRTRCRNRGYLGPMHWDDIDHDPEPATATEIEPVVDEVAIMRRMGGERVALSRAEKVALVAMAQALGWSYRDITERTGITKVERYVTHDVEEAS